MRTFRSAPRPPGASMVVAPDGTVSRIGLGWLCGRRRLRAGHRGGRAPADRSLQRYGVSDDDAFAVGLTCGGIIDVFVEPVSQRTFPELDAVAEDIAGHASGDRDRDRPPRTPDGRPAAGRPAGRVDGLARLGAGSTPRSPTTPADCWRRAAPRSSPTGPTASGGERAWTCSSPAMRRAPRMLVFGAIDFAAAVARHGAFLGYRVTVCDARPVFATPARFPTADEVVVDWPHRYLAAEAEAGAVDGRTVICVLTHDPKFDVPLLEVALRLPEVGYVGAMGSRRTHDDRLARLREAGLDRRRADPAGAPDRPGSRAPARRRRPRCRSRPRSSRALGRRRPTACRDRRPNPPRPGHLRNIRAGEERVKRSLN